MLIKELRLVGFKSFLDKTTLRFSPEMNAIIGPNGCGKTNVLDALRWVLGEQSFTLLRCAKNEDLIFGGTTSVPPLNVAEVKLILSNDSLPQYPAEVEIRRRYFRSGESEYYLNRQPCRLKDIQEVFLASGIGTKAYTVFDLRQMREIIAGNIRKMFEEAAALAKYRESKADCQRKLELTEADLIRLEDIIAERERVVRSLKRQAGRLRSYSALKEEERGLRLIELKTEFESIATEFEQVEKDCGVLEAAEQERLGEIREVEAELQRQRARLRTGQGKRDELLEQVRRFRQELAELEGRELLDRQKVQFMRDGVDRDERERRELDQGLSQLEGTYNQATERLATATSRLGAVEADLKTAQDGTREAEQRLSELRSQELTARENLEGLVARQNDLRRRFAGLEANAANREASRQRADAGRTEIGRRLAAARQELGAAAEATEELSVQLAAERRRIVEAEDRLAAALREDADLGQEARRLAERRVQLERQLAVIQAAAPQAGEAIRAKLGGDRNIEDLTGLLVVESGWESACEAALRPLVDHQVTDRPFVSTELRQLAAAGPATGCGIIVGTEEGVEGPVPEELPGTSGRLTDHLSFKPGAPPLVRQYAARFLVADGPEELVRLKATYPGVEFVLKEGCALTADGRVFVAGSGSGPLRIQGLAADRQAELESVTAESAVAEGRRADLEAGIDRIRLEIGAAKDAVGELLSRHATVAANRESLAARCTELERDQRRADSELNQLGDEDDADRGLASLKSEVERADAAAGRQSAALRNLQDQVSTAEAEVKRRLELAAGQLAEFAEAKNAVARLETERDFHRQTIEERRRRVAALKQASARALEEAEELEAAAIERVPAVESKKSEIAEVESRIEELQVADIVRVEEELEGRLSALREGRDQNQSVLMELRLRRHDINQRQVAIVREAREEHGTDIARYEPEAAEDAAERLELVRRRLEALGAVNPLAADEYQQEKTDLQRLIVQRDDVVQARDNLNQSIAEIDRHARERFLETYAEVREAFKDVFRELFLEGEADLMLADESNPLVSEIDIVARPRGKTPKRLEQLSDGEKALLAVSLLFAFYRVKPAPFCFLDEIDAPLDDANVGRFADHLKSISRATQVVIITHNRLTVERADALFGITAEQPGVSKLVSVSLADYRSSPAAADVR